ncbi:uncharacterized protein LOC133320737 [Danaus plexippus]|uniref:uncharacterized protein LOC133320737 n=1 Tax=Danaus plexippus TaxID=13037 RepID=UPI002AB2CFC5|nr:uncharacterized protein LOC133320737 [Danaus plexippus]
MCRYETLRSKAFLDSPESCFSRWIVASNFLYPMRPNFVRVKDIGACQLLCQKTEDCVYFIFAWKNNFLYINNPKDTNCLLYTKNQIEITMNAMVPEPGIYHASGYDYQYCNAAVFSLCMTQRLSCLRCSERLRCAYRESDDEFSGPKICPSTGKFNLCDYTYKTTTPTTTTTTPTTTTTTPTTTTTTTTPTTTITTTTPTTTTTTPTTTTTTPTTTPDPNTTLTPKPVPVEPTQSTPEETFPDNPEIPPSPDIPDEPVNPNEEKEEKIPGIVVPILSATGGAAALAFAGYSAYSFASPSVTAREEDFADNDLNENNVEQTAKIDAEAFL